MSGSTKIDFLYYATELKNPDKNKTIVEII